MEKTLVYQPSVYRLTILYRVFSTHVFTLGSGCNHPINTAYRFLRFTFCVAVFRITFLLAPTCWEFLCFVQPRFLREFGFWAADIKDFVDRKCTYCVAIATDKSYISAVDRARFINSPGKLIV